MRLAQGGEMDWSTAASGQHRVGTMSFKRLLDGEKGTPENYSFSLAKPVGDFFSPRHRHNFDQFRFALREDYDIGPKVSLKEGQLGYFPEGSYYGPYDTPETNETLVLQFGGTSGQGYVSMDEVREGFRALSETGRFEDGAYKTETPDGRKKNIDAYEAIWSHLMGRKLEYPKPRYTMPILVDPAAFDWTPVPGQSGVSHKCLGMFTERGTRVDMLQLDAGATAVLPSEDAIRLAFVLDGKGAVGDQAYKPHSAIEWTAREEGRLDAKAASLLLVMVLPMLHLDATAAAA